MKVLNLTNLEHSDIKYKVSLILGFIVSLLTSLMFYTSKQSNIFHIECDKLEALVENVKTKKELEDLYENEFKEVKKKSLGDYHSVRLREVYIIMKTKYKFVE